MKRSTKNLYGKQFTIEDVKELGRALISVADQFPMRFLTELDFTPLVIAYLRGRVPALHSEYSVKGGNVDFRIGGTNPSLLEIAVAPRALRDPHASEVKFAGHGKATQLYASMNRTELRKLGAMPQSQAKMRYLLLVDFRRAFQRHVLKNKYKGEAKKLTNRVTVVYVSRKTTFRFTVGG